MGSETDQVAIEDSDESTLDIKEINDLEYDIPPVYPLSLESILWDMESSEGSDNTSLHSLQSLTLKFRSMLYHGILKGISSQVASAGEKVQAGLPTVISNSTKLVAIGTSHGYILTFDSEQKMCWCCHDSTTTDQGAISALAFNLDSSRLLAGYERGYISMIDTTTGDVIRRLPDAHAPQSAVLQLRFTILNNLALCGDSSGCVFSLTFMRRLGVRSWDSKCLFSGARGEVCVFEPLIKGQELLGQNIILAMATLSKVIVITIRPKLKVIFSQQLPKATMYLPLLSWQLVPVGKMLQPVLAWGRGAELNYTRIIFTGMNSNKIRLSPLRCVKLSYNLLAMHWLGQRHLAILDTSENLRLIDVRTQRELEMLEIESAGLVYSSAHFKALASGGGVSEAFALAGERACYNSISSGGEQLLVLGTKAVHLVKLRNWQERLFYLSEQGRWAEALNLAAEEGQNREKCTLALLNSFLGNINQNCVDKENLTAAVNCCIKINNIDLLCNELWDAISNDKYNQELYFSLLAEHIKNGSINYLSPSITQLLVLHLEKKNPNLLEKILLCLEVTCLDLHQVLNITKEKRLYDAWIYITSKTIGDYTSPLIEFLHELTPDNHRLGNTMLVYVSSCFAGLGYPKGKIPEKDVHRAKHDILRCLEAPRSVRSENEQLYPYLRALLNYNVRECLNVISLAFTEAEFSGEIGLLQRKRLVEILLQIVKSPEFNHSQMINLSCFISRLVTSNSLTIEDTMMNLIIENLTKITIEQISIRDHLDREQAWLDLYKNEKLNHFTTEDILKQAVKSKCYRVAEAIYEQKKDYSKILGCYLNDPIRKDLVFSYIRTYINTPDRCILEQFKVNFKTLLNLNSKKTSELVIESFPNIVETLCESLDNDCDLLYAFLREIVYSDVKISSGLAEKYLELLCSKDCESVVSYLYLHLCQVEKALEITKKYGIHSATAVLLEESGDYTEALKLLLDNDLIEMAVETCIRGAEHLDSKGAQELWLMLLKHPFSNKCMSLRELLHSAAPHVPPVQLLELVSDVNLGDVKILLRGILADYKHDVEMFGTTLKILSRDLHCSLTKQLCISGKGTLVSKPICYLCQLPLLSIKISNRENTSVVRGCGHCFHKSCMKSSGEQPCPQCQKVTIFLPELKKQREVKNKDESKNMRPDLEGLF